MTLLDWYAGQALTGLLASPESRMPFDVVQRLAYDHAEAMLVEKARREATGKDSLTVQTREVDDDRWAKFQDGFRISFQPTIGWCAEIRDGSMGYGNTIAEAVANLRARWEERSAAPVVQQTSTTESYITDKNGIPVARVTHVPILDHSPDATKMIELQAANRELVEALEALLARDQRNTCRHEETHRGGSIWETCNQCGVAWADDEGGKPEWQDPEEWVKAEVILSKHKGAK